MDDSSSRSQPATPDRSSSPTPTSLPEPTPDPGAPAAPRDSSADDAKSTRARGRPRKKTTRRKASKRKTSSRSSKVDPGDPPKAGRPGSSASAPTVVDPATIRKVLEQGGATTHYLGCEVLGLDPNQNRDLFTLTKQELDDLAPPVARIASRHAAAARLVEASDELVVATVVGKAVIRNVIDARWAIDKANSELPAEPEPAEAEGGRDVGLTGEARDVSTARG